MPRNPEKSRREGNRYDKIFKENTEAILLPLLGKLLKVELEILERLTEKRQTTIEREVDFLARVRLEGKVGLLHVEYQTQVESGLLERFAEYHGMLYRKFKLPITHVMIYLGDKPFSGPKRIPEPEVFRQIEVVAPIESSFEAFLSSSIPEEVILAILSDFQGRDPKAVFRLIFQQLRQLSTDEAALKKYLNQLGMLSKLRKLDQTFISIRKNMPITYDIAQDAMYQQGKLEGKTEGITEGIAKGKAEGIAEGITKGRKMEARERRIKEIYDIIRIGNENGLQKTLLAQLARVPIKKVEEVLKKIEAAQKKTE
ncbi:MAG: hypothetical protein AAGI38_18045 [Bacteroidota bacterium]